MQTSACARRRREPFRAFPSIPQPRSPKTGIRPAPVQVLSDDPRVPPFRAAPIGDDCEPDPFDAWQKRAVAYARRMWGLSRALLAETCLRKSTGILAGRVPKS